MFEHLPGGDLLAEGLRDLRDGVRSVAAMLVLAGQGIQVQPSFERPHLPEHALYDLLVIQHGEPAAYPRYQALIRLLVSLENALDLVGHRADAVHEGSFQLPGGGSSSKARPSSR